MHTRTQARFEPLETQYRMLEKFEVSVKESEIAKLATLRPEWAEYKQKLHEANTRLQKAKADFKDDLLQSLTDFNNHTQAVRSEFLRAGPFDAEPTVAKAKEIIQEAGHLGILENKDDLMGEEVKVKKPKKNPSEEPIPKTSNIEGKENKTNDPRSLSKL